MNLEQELLNSEILDGETYYKVTPSKSKYEELADKAYAQLSAELEIGREYEGIVKNVFVEETNYPKLIISYEVDDDGISKNVADTYTFGGEYDEWYMTQLVKFIQQVDNLYKNDINTIRRFCLFALDLRRFVWFCLLFFILENIVIFAETAII